jgi:hypothetical protein
VVSDPTLASYRGAFMRNGIEVNYATPEGGKVATYFARWCGAGGDVSPWSQPVFMRIAA